MLSKSDIKLKITSAVKKVMINAKADEGETPVEGTPAPTPAAQSINFEQLISTARTEEKNKLYPRIKKLEEEKGFLQQNQNGYLLEIAELKVKLEAALKENGTSKITELTSTIDSLNAEIKKLKESAPKEEEIRKAIEAEYAVKFYAQKRVAEVGDSIIKELITEVKGSTEEEVEASIKALTERSISIKKSLGLLDDEGKPIVNKPAATENYQPSKKAPVANPATVGDKSLDANFIRSLDPSSQEYKDIRKKMGLR